MLENHSAFTQNFVASVEDGLAGSFTFEFGSSLSGPAMFTVQATGVPGNSPASVGLISQCHHRRTDYLFYDMGASIAGAVGGQTSLIYQGSEITNATIINDGASARGATGGMSYFEIGKTNASNAILIANSGTNGGGGFVFENSADGGTAQGQIHGNGFIDISLHNAPGFTIGSIEGDGQIYFGTNTLIVGTNSLSTTFAGVLHQGDPTGSSGSGGLTKLGPGTLSSPAPTYTAKGTGVSAGTLLVNNTSGSGTGTGYVQVDSGTLGGSGVISGPVTIGTGSGGGAFLTPGAGGKQTTLTLQSSLTLNSDATYTSTCKANRSRVRTDQVIANGVTINNATLSLTSSSQSRIKRGTVLTLISNISANPIVGAFSNLPDGGTITIGSTNFQASYSGGDGNDLTLTVVP